MEEIYRSGNSLRVRLGGKVPFVQVTPNIISFMSVLLALGAARDSSLTAR
jgi:hypothetical protein